MDTILKNLRIAFPEKSFSELKQIKRKFFLHMIRNFWEWLNLPKITKEDLEKKVVFDPSQEEICNWTKVRPLLLCTGHVGNWEMANVVGEYYARPYGVIVRKQRGVVARWLAQKRLLRDITIWEAGRNERQILKKAQELSIGTVIDHRVRNGIKVRFFSKGCYFPKGVVWFARKLSAKLLPSFAVHEGKKLRIKVLGPPMAVEDLEDQEIAQSLTSHLEEVVRQYPEQYLWTFKRWKYSWEIIVCLLKDGRLGHVRQGQALIEYIRWAYPDKEVRVEEIDLAGIERESRRRWLTILPFLPLEIGEALVKKLLPEQASPLLNRYYDVIASVGSSLVGLNIFLKRYNLARNLVVMDPGRIYRSDFDLIIAPSHDEVSGSNVYTIPGALSLFDPEKALARAKELNLPDADVAVLIGGPIKGYGMDEKDLLPLLETLITSGKKVLITTSRRTPVWIENWIANHRDRFAYAVIVSQHNPSGLVPAFFARTSRVICTPDSISMVSEAVVSGSEVGIWIGGGLPGGKHRRFLETMTFQGRVKKLSTRQELAAFLQSHGKSPREIGQRGIDENLVQNIKRALGF